MACYIALIHKEPNSGFGISFPDVPGVTAVADTLDDAMREAAVVLGYAFKDWLGEQPVPCTLDVLRQDPDFWIIQPTPWLPPSLRHQASPTPRKSPPRPAKLKRPHR